MKNLFKFRILYIRLILIFFVFSTALAGFCDYKETSYEDLFRALKGSNEFDIRRSYPHIKHNLPTDEIIRMNGYPEETHYVTTDDGYILTLHRIPAGKDDRRQKEGRPVVFVAHGLFCSSADFVVSDPSKGLGYLLADAGYDVWLGNYRGNTYSRNHTYLDPDDQSGGFWDFSWDEMAKYDTPAMIEMILEHTGSMDLQYIGHSMGTSTYFAMPHYRPDLMNKIRLAHLMAPVAYVGHMESPIAWIAGFGNPIHIILEWLGIGEFLPNTLLVDCLASLFCQEGLTQGICSNIMFIFCGFDEPQMNKTLLETVLHHTPAGSSTTTILQYAQEVVSDNFEGYDWGSEEANLQHHGQISPPLYSLSEVTSPVAMYWGLNDWLAAQEDVERTLLELPNLVPGTELAVEYPAWNHLDFLWAIDADKYVYKPLMENMEKCRLQDCTNL